MGKLLMSHEWDWYWSDIYLPNKFKTKKFFEKESFELKGWQKQMFGITL